MSVLAMLEARARDDPAWWAVIDQYLDGLREHPRPFHHRHHGGITDAGSGLSVEG